MNNKQNNDGNTPGPTKDRKTGIEKLPLMEMYAVLGLELSQKILEKLQQIEDSVEILARQKARELEKSKTETGGKAE